MAFCFVANVVLFPATQPYQKPFLQYFFRGHFFNLLPISDMEVLSKFVQQRLGKIV